MTGLARRDDDGLAFEETPVGPGGAYLPRRGRW
jgi:hypothetical protein